jgi:hypothetical protein
MRSFAASAALVLALGMVPNTTPLQAQRPVALGVGGGVPVPLGDFRDEVNPGWRALGTLAFGVPMLPLGLRLDAAYDRLGFKRTLVGSVGSSAGAQRVVSVTLNPTYRVPMTGSPFSPYLIGGGGVYSVGCAGDVSCDAVTRAGWNAGLGARFAGVGLHGFAEARYHQVEVRGGRLQYVPFTLGLLF